jgi:hypothetical protein
MSDQTTKSWLVNANHDQLDLQPSKSDDRSLQAVQVVANLGIRPVRVADNLPANHASAVDDVGLWPSLGAVHLCHRLIRVAHRGHVYVIAVEESAVRSRVRVNADCENRQVGPVAVQLFQSWCLLDARGTLTPPEIQQHHLAPVIRQVNRVLPVADCKVRSDFIGVGRMRTAIAAARKRQREQGTNSNETRKPHILIIRSDGD